MKAIILAAGEGTRLKPLTDNVPKCMVEYKGKPIIDYIIDTYNNSGIEDIVIVNGYKRDALETHLSGRKVRFVHNKDFSTTNMVYTLFCAEKEMDDDIIISYADIIYDKSILEILLKVQSDIAVVVDKKWKELWAKRMENPLSDAETMKIDNSGSIIELGKKPKSYDDIQGQYMGLIKFSKKACKEIIDFYHSLDKNSIYDGKNFYNMYMTSFIQLIIDKLSVVKAVNVNGGWCEFDTLSDLNVDF